MPAIKLYPEWEKAVFIERMNRFVMSLEKDGKNINAYIANPGRMEEYLVPGQPFFLIRATQGKYRYRAVSTVYENSYVLLDTGKVNDVVERMIENDKIPELGEIRNIRREFPIERSRFDFLLSTGGPLRGQPQKALRAISARCATSRTAHNDRSLESQNKQVLLEVKSCSLCHGGVAMFPDAPTARGRRHLQELELLSKQGYETFTLYLITNRDARVFLANGHTDPEYCETFNRVKSVHRLAYKVEMPDPVSVDISQSRKVPVDFEGSRSLGRDGGSYLLVLHNARTFTKKIGALGEREFKEGYYVYVGSALKGLDNRIKRHMRKKKKIHWHLDYVFPFHMKKVKVFKIVTGKNIERAAASSEPTPSASQPPLPGGEYCRNSRKTINSTLRNPLLLDLNGGTPEGWGGLSLRKNKSFSAGISIEKQLAREMSNICRAYVPGFGSSDTGEPSHFFYFRENPVRNRNFLNLLLDFRMLLASGGQGALLKNRPLDPHKTVV